MEHLLSTLGAKGGDQWIKGNEGYDMTFGGVLLFPIHYLLYS